MPWEVQYLLPFTEKTKQWNVNQFKRNPYTIKEDDCEIHIYNSTFFITINGWDQISIVCDGKITWLGHSIEAYRNHPVILKYKGFAQERS